MGVNVNDRSLGFSSCSSGQSSSSIRIEMTSNLTLVGDFDKCSVVSILGRLPSCDGGGGGGGGMGVKGRVLGFSSCSSGWSSSSSSMCIESSNVGSVAVML